MKISPAMPFNDIHDDDPIETYTTLVKAIAPMGLGYLHVLRTPPLPNIFEVLRPLFPGPFAAGGGFEHQSGDAMLASGGADFIVFGKPFTSNPDLPERFAAGAPLTPFDASTFYTPGARDTSTSPRCPLRALAPRTKNEERRTSSAPDSVADHKALDHKWQAQRRAEAHIVNRSKNVGCIECDVTDQRGKQIAKARSTCFVLRGEHTKLR